MVNDFSYDHPTISCEHPLTITTEVMSALIGPADFRTPPRTTRGSSATCLATQASTSLHLLPHRIAEQVGEHHRIAGPLPGFAIPDSVRKPRVEDFRPETG
jgi:hypothetical protein